MGDMSALETLLVTAVSGLVGAIVYLYKIHLEATRKCEADRDALWDFILAKLPLTCTVPGCDRRALLDVADLPPGRRRQLGEKLSSGGMA